MTYSHNSVSKNLKMTTAAAATATAAATVRTKDGAGGGAVKNSGSSNSPPSTPPLSAHSNSIASNSTNNHNHQHQLMLSNSPPDSNMSSAISTGSNCSISSVSSISSNSNGSGNRYFASIRKQQRQQQQQQQQRRSPQQHQQHNDIGSYFNNNQNCNYQSQTQQQPGSASKRYGVSGGGSSQKYRDVQQSPQNHQSTCQSPAVILGGVLSISPVISNSGGNNSTRRPRSKHSSPLLSVGGGKISPAHSLIPTALTHFAGSKCFDAPAPTALPKPPERWTGSQSVDKVTSSAGPGLKNVLSAAAVRTFHNYHRHDSHSYGGHVVKSSKRNLLDDFDTNNLKLLLNVQS